MDSSKKTKETENNQEKKNIHSDEEADDLLKKIQEDQKIEDENIDKEFKYKIKSKTSYRNIKNSHTINNVTSNKNSSIFKSDSELRDEAPLNINSNNFFGKEMTEYKITRSKHSSGKSENNAYKKTKSNRLRTYSETNSNKNFNMNIQNQEIENKEETEKNQSSNLITNSHLNNTIILQVKKNSIFYFLCIFHYIIIIIFRIF